MQSCTAVTGLILLVITDLGTIISFATPVWILHGSDIDRGLWAVCKGTNCEWIYNYNVNPKDFHKDGKYTLHHLNICPHNINCFGLMAFNATFNNISVTSWRLHTRIQ
jgi:hypothetical protein